MIDRTTVRTVLLAHLRLLERDNSDSWPRCSPREAVRDILIGETSAEDHIDAVLEHVSPRGAS